jgi:hypothetical protein
MGSPVRSTASWTLAQAMSCQRDEGVAGHFVPSNKTPRKKHVEIMSDVREEVGKR